MASADDGTAIQDDLQGLVDPETAAAIQAKTSKQVVEDVWVLEENWKAVSLFCDCSTQWRTSFSGKMQGLRYESVDVVIKRGGYEPFGDEDWRRLLVLERKVISELNQS